MNTISQISFDSLCQLHIVKNTEGNKGISWECCNAVEYFKEKEDDNSINHKFLME
jgi:hypothetical protein